MSSDLGHTPRHAWMPVDAPSCPQKQDILPDMPGCLYRVLWAGILHLAQPLSWADTLSGFFELSWAEPAQGVLSQIEPAWAGSTQLKDWASLSWEDLELSNWARLSWSCFSLSQLELDRYFMNFWEKNQIFWPKMSFFDQKCHFSPFFGYSAWARVS